MQTIFKCLGGLCLRLVIISSLTHAKNITVSSGANKEHYLDYLQNIFFRYTKLAFFQIAIFLPGKMEGQ